MAPSKTFALTHLAHDVVRYAVAIDDGKALLVAQLRRNSRLAARNASREADDPHALLLHSLFFSLVFSSEGAYQDGSNE